jgi:hypothetical protein
MLASRLVAAAVAPRLALAGRALPSSAMKVAATSGLFSSATSGTTAKRGMSSSSSTPHYCAPACAADPRCNRGVCREQAALSQRQRDLIATEDAHGAHNYHPLPVVLSRGEGCFLYDVDGKRYFDYLSAYSAVNQGHCHPKIVGALVDQAKKLCLTSRAFHHDQMAHFAEYISTYFDQV